MEDPVKPACYDSDCLCTECQLYDVHCAKSSSVSTTSFLPSRYAASLLSSPVTSCTVSSVLSTRPSCSVAESTCGLSSTFVPARRPSHVRRRFDFALSSSSFVLPVSSAAPVAVPSSPVAVSSSSVAVSSSPVPPSPVAVSSPVVPPSTIAVSSSPVAVSSVLPSPVSSVPPSCTVASSGAVSSLPATPVLPRRSLSFVPPRVRPVPVWSRPVPPSRPIRYVAPPPRLPPCPSFLPRVPVVCLVLVAVPVLLATPFGFVLSFLLR